MTRYFQPMTRDEFIAAHLGEFVKGGGNDGALSGVLSLDGATFWQLTASEIGGGELRRPKSEILGRIYDAFIASEAVRLADGEHRQALVPGVEPIALAHRDCAATERARASRRGAAPMPAGGLFDDVARAQASLF